MDTRPTDIRLRKLSNLLELTYADGRCFNLPAEYLRVYSPSAEVKGHGTGQEVLQYGKRHVRLCGVSPVGHYGIKLVFDDDHSSGIYTWDYLYELGNKQNDLWQDYLQRLAAAGRLRDDAQVIKIVDPAKTD
ncbi:gamma-butyrobetaine hydroxylase-like domain-containing protein [Pseudohongiella spirulinae]|uniref:Gamma-butyrobetaine hydroxylase-like N-terminal domain-containing protein n=1 Tax=Pseudohongiella spirulinae TaxID=1249552 RepID=A0A0S2KGT7_9GAMM|nr:DUF971 domain-containing protein [Pseudohongiella spirulinae]ALO47326.1 hypothetical protein PS2015_2694 [Pseudohongiella spirulinae]